MPDDLIMLRITEAISALHDGNRDEARSQFETIWAEVKDKPNPFHVCTLSHYMADLQEDSCIELRWDLRALRAARLTTAADARAYQSSLDIQAFFPSLHLNVAHGYFALGKLREARRHVEAGLSATRFLPENAYLITIRHGLERLAKSIGDSD